MCGIIIIATSVHDERPRTRTELPARIVFHVTLTSVDSYRCDSIVWLNFSKICLPHPSTTASSMFCWFAKFLPKRKTWGRTRQRPATTDFHRKVNKFWQRFAKCDNARDWLKILWKSLPALFWSRRKSFYTFLYRRKSSGNLRKSSEIFVYHRKPSVNLRKFRFCWDEKSHAFYWNKVGRYSVIVYNVTFRWEFAYKKKNNITPRIMSLGRLCLS